MRRDTAHLVSPVGKHWPTMALPAALWPLAHAQGTGYGMGVLFGDGGEVLLGRGCHEPLLGCLQNLPPPASRLSGPPKVERSHHITSIGYGMALDRTCSSLSWTNDPCVLLQTEVSRGHPGPPPRHALGRGQHHCHLARLNVDRDDSSRRVESVGLLTVAGQPVDR